MWGEAQELDLELLRQEMKWWFNLPCSGLP